MNDTGLGNALQTTTYDLSHIYLTVMQSTNFNFRSRNLVFGEFCEVLVKCAVVGFRGKNVSIADKTMALFMFLSRNVEVIVSSVLLGKGSCTAPENAVFVSKFSEGIRELHVRFTNAWAQDGFRDYLADIPDPVSTTNMDLLQMIQTVPMRAIAVGEDCAGHDNEGSTIDEFEIVSESMLGRSFIKGSIHRAAPDSLVRIQKLVASRPSISHNITKVVDSIHH
jgi:hypothetical protein